MPLAQYDISLQDPAQWIKDALGFNNLPRDPLGPDAGTFTYPDLLVGRPVPGGTIDSSTLPQPMPGAVPTVAANGNPAQTTVSASTVMSTLASIESWAAKSFVAHPWVWFIVALVILFWLLSGKVKL